MPTGRRALAARGLGPGRCRGRLAAAQAGGPAGAFLRCNGARALNPPQLRVKSLRTAAYKDWTNASGAGTDWEGRSSLNAAMTIKYRLALFMLLLLPAAPAVAEAAGVDCRAPRMAPADITICTDGQLTRADEQLSRRLARASRQLAFGPYVGLRVWQSDWRQQRTDCGADRVCLAGVYNDANRFLDRFQRCLGTSLRGRRCLPVSVEGERSAVRRP
jgi:hypothetical protein